MNGTYVTVGGPGLLVVVGEVRCPGSERDLSLIGSPDAFLQARSLTRVQPDGTSTEAAETMRASAGTCVGARRMRPGAQRRSRTTHVSPSRPMVCLPAMANWTSLRLSLLPCLARRVSHFPVKDLLLSHCQARLWGRTQAKTAASRCVTWMDLPLLTLLW